MYRAYPKKDDYVIMPDGKKYYPYRGGRGLITEKVERVIRLLNSIRPY